MQRNEHAVLGAQLHGWRCSWETLKDGQFPALSGWVRNEVLGMMQVRSDILDWHGDHPATNYHEMYDALRDAGYFLEVLGSPLSCFDAKQVRCALSSI